MEIIRDKLKMYLNMCDLYTEIFNTCTGEQTDVYIGTHTYTAETLDKLKDHCCGSRTVIIYPEFVFMSD